MGGGTPKIWHCIMAGRCSGTIMLAGWTPKWGLSWEAAKRKHRFIEYYTTKKSKPRTYRELFNNASCNIAITLPWMQGLTTGLQIKSTFQITFWTSSPQILLALGKFYWHVSLQFFFSWQMTCLRPYPAVQVWMKSYLPRTAGKFTCLEWLEGTFFKPCLTM